MWYYLHLLMKWATRLDSDQWFWVLIGVTVIGALCMRGFGSRKHC